MNEQQTDETGETWIGRSWRHVRRHGAAPRERLERLPRDVRFESSGRPRRLLLLLLRSIRQSVEHNDAALVADQHLRKRADR